MSTPADQNWVRDKTGYDLIRFPWAGQPPVVSGPRALASVLTPNALTTNTDNYDPTVNQVEQEGASVLRLSSTQAVNITGLVPGVGGEIKLLMNIGSFNITLSNNSGSSTAANRFQFGVNVVIVPGQGVQIWYDLIALCWRLTEALGSGAGAGDVVGPSSATDNAIARFDLTTGKLIQNSGVVIDDSNNITGVNTINIGNADTTLARVSAGVISAEGNELLSTLTGQPLDADLTAIAALTTAAYGRSLLTLANATALAAEVDSFFLTPAEGNAAYQPIDADLTSWAAIARAAGFDTFVATPSSANLASLVTGETGSGALVFGTSPTFTTSFLMGSGFVQDWNSDVTLTHATNALTWAGASTGYFFSDGFLISGHTASVAIVDETGAGLNPRFEVQGTDAHTSALSSTRWSANATPSRIALGKSRGASVGSHTIVQSGDQLAVLVVAGSDGTDFAPAAAIIFEVDGTPGNNDMPGRIVFGTTADGAAAVTNRVILDSSGLFKPATNDGATLGGTANGWADFHLATGGTINWANGDVVITHSTNLLAFTGATSGYTVDNVAYFPEATLTDGATINWDTAAAQTAKVTLGGNRTLAAPTNLKAGATYVLRVIQDGTGSRTITWNAAYEFPGGTDPTLSTGAGDIDVITFVSDGTSMFGVCSKDFA